MESKDGLFGLLISQSRRCLAPGIRDKLKTHLENTEPTAVQNSCFLVCLLFQKETCDVQWVLLTLVLPMFHHCTQPLLVAATSCYVFVSFL